MIKKIKSNAQVGKIVMPENLEVGLMVFDHRNKCKKIKCSFDYFALGFGESPFHVAPPLVKALCKNANKGQYSSAIGIVELRKVIADFNKRHFKLNVHPDRVVIGHGTKGLMHTIFNMIEGHVIIPSPSWIGYYPQLILLGKKYHTLYLDPKKEYKLTAKELNIFLLRLNEKHKKQHLLVLNHPNNPTGVIYSKKELTDIAKVCKKHNTLILSDEIYALSTYNIKNFTSMGKVYPEGTFVTNGISKDRSAGGYRLGYCILPTLFSKKLMLDFKKIAATVYTNVSTPTQYAAITAFKPNKEIEEYFKITRNIHRMIGGFMATEVNKISGLKATIPKGGFYFFLDFNSLKSKLRKKGVKTSNQLADSLISHPHHIAVVTGDACMLKPTDFGARIAFVDYNGEKAFDAYKKKFKTTYPKTKAEELEFIKKNVPRIVKAISAFRKYVGFVNG
jgi:aspartate aminotransferase